MAEKTELDNAWSVSETDATQAWDNLDKSINPEDLLDQWDETFDKTLHEIDKNTSESKSELLKSFFNNLDDKNLIKMSETIFRNKDTNTYLSRKQMIQHPLYALITEQYIQRLLPNNGEKIDSTYDSVETIKKFQDKVGSKVDGKFGPHTLEKAEYYLDFHQKSTDPDWFNPYDLNIWWSEGQSVNTENWQTIKEDPIDYSKDDQGNSIDFDKDENGNTIKEISDIKDIPDTIEKGNIYRINIDGVLCVFFEGHTVSIDGYGIHTWDKDDQKNLRINNKPFTTINNIYDKTWKIIIPMMDIYSLKNPSIIEDCVYAVPLTSSHGETVTCFFWSNGIVTIPGKEWSYVWSKDKEDNLLINGKLYTSIEDITTSVVVDSVQTWVTSKLATDTINSTKEKQLKKWIMDLMISNLKKYTFPLKDLITREDFIDSSKYDKYLATLPNGMVSLQSAQRVEKKSGNRVPVNNITNTNYLWIELFEDSSSIMPISSITTGWVYDEAKAKRNMKELLRKEILKVS